MSTYFERYKNGEYEQVWAELLALGGQIRQEPLYSDALAVAYETMRRTKYNVELLVKRLDQLNYQFSEIEFVYNKPTQEDLELLNEFEESIGFLPLSLRTWYEVVGSVTFIGSHPFLSFDTDVDNPNNFLSESDYQDFLKRYKENRWLSDPLTIFPLALNWTIPPKDSQVNPSKPKLTFNICGDIYIKAGFSGGIDFRIEVPDLAIDAKLLVNLNKEWEGRYFVEYLREVFRWGGFPGLKHYPNHDKDILAFLTKGLLPI